MFQKVYEILIEAILLLTFSAEHGRVHAKPKRQNEPDPSGAEEIKGRNEKERRETRQIN